MVSTLESSDIEKGIHKKIWPITLVCIEHISGWLKEAKKTFLYLKALEIAGIETRNEIIRVYNDLSISDNERVKLIKYYFIELGIKEVAELEMERFYSLGLEFLKKIEIPEEQFRLLLSISTSMMERSH